VDENITNIHILLGAKEENNRNVNDGVIGLNNSWYENDRFAINGLIGEREKIELCGFSKMF